MILWSVFPQYLKHTSITEFNSTKTSLRTYSMPGMVLDARQYKNSCPHGASNPLRKDSKQFSVSDGSNCYGEEQSKGKGIRVSRFFVVIVCVFNYK